MSGHTPGDWIARPDPHGSPTDFCIGLDDDCSPVDYVAVCHARDARLIAAAPLLLQELRGASTQMERAAECIEAGRYDEALLYVRSMSRSRRTAIAAATGEQP